MSGARVRPDAQRVHPAVEAIGAALDAWLDKFSLGDERLREARFHVLAARVLPDGARVNVELLAQWTAWLATQSGAAAHSDLASVIEGTVSAEETAPAVLALADLWPRTAVGMSLSWRRRCLQHAHDGSGLIVYDIVESVRRTEIPIGIAHSTAWKTICGTVGELTEWCENDPPMEEVQHRLDRLSAAQLELVRHLRSCHPAIYAPVLEVAETICAIPGARLAWRQEISP